MKGPTMHAKIEDIVKLHNEYVQRFGEPSVGIIQVGPQGLYDALKKALDEVVELVKEKFI